MYKNRMFSIILILFTIFFQFFPNYAFANVSLTFDVEGGRDIEKVLDTLAAYQVKAAFFPVGTWIERYPELARRIIIEGHEIGNHSYSHPDLTKMSNEQIIKDIQKAETVIVNTTGASPRPFFRPPYGAVNSRVHQAVGEAGYSYSCLWNIDPRDWDGKSATAITSIVLENLRSGAIMLFHINRTNTPEALPNILDGIMQKGYSIVPLSQQIGNNQKTITRTKVPDLVETASPHINSANFAVNGQPVTMMSRPAIICNRILVPIRELAKILGGEVMWEDESKQAVLSVRDQTFQFFINGDTFINGKKTADMPSAVLTNNTSMVPLVVICRQLDLPLYWDDATRTANLIVSTDCIKGCEILPKQESTNNQNNQEIPR